MKLKQYQYKPSCFFVQVTLPGIFTALIGLFSIYQMIVSDYGPAYGFVLLVAIYHVWNTFVSVSNPEKISVNANKILFHAYGKEHSYDLDEIEHFYMRMIGGRKRIYLTINHGGIFRGRYWIRLEEFSENTEVEEKLSQMEAQIHPNSILVEAKKQGKERLKKKGVPYV